MGRDHRRTPEIRTVKQLTWQIVVSGTRNSHVVAAATEFSSISGIPRPRNISHATVASERVCQDERVGGRWGISGSCHWAKWGPSRLKSGAACAPNSSPWRLQTGRSNRPPEPRGGWRRAGAAGCPSSAEAPFPNRHDHIDCACITHYPNRPSISLESNTVGRCPRATTGADTNVCATMCFGRKTGEQERIRLTSGPRESITAHDNRIARGRSFSEINIRLCIFSIAMPCPVIEWLDRITRTNSNRSVQNY
jgi:hypothetical protein